MCNCRCDGQWSRIAIIKQDDFILTDNPELVRYFGGTKAENYEDGQAMHTWRIEHLIRSGSRHFMYRRFNNAIMPYVAYIDVDNNRIITTHKAKLTCFSIEPFEIRWQHETRGESLQQGIVLGHRDDCYVFLDVDFNGQNETNLVCLNNDGNEKWRVNPAEYSIIRDGFGNWSPTVNVKAGNVMMSARSPYIVLRTYEDVEHGYSILSAVTGEKLRNHQAFPKADHRPEPLEALAEAFPEGAGVANWFGLYYSEHREYLPDELWWYDWEFFGIHDTKLICTGWKYELQEATYVNRVDPTFDPEPVWYYTGTQRIVALDVLTNEVDELIPGTIIGNPFVPFSDYDDAGYFPDYPPIIYEPTLTSVVIDQRFLCIGPLIIDLDELEVRRIVSIDEDDEAEVNVIGILPDYVVTGGAGSTAKIYEGETELSLVTDHHVPRASSGKDYPHGIYQPIEYIGQHGAAIVSRTIVAYNVLSKNFEPYEQPEANE